MKRKNSSLTPRILINTPNCTDITPRCLELSAAWIQSMKYEHGVPIFPILTLRKWC